MGIGTDDFGYPKPGEDDFYDIGVFNRAMDMVDKDLKDLGDKKQDKLAIGTFTGNIDVLGEGGLPQTSSICLCQSNKIEGVLPYESENEYWFTLKTSHAAEHSPGAARTQKAIVHSADGITVFGRMSMDGAWGGWRESLWADGDLKDNTCTFESDDEVLVKMGVPTIGGESQLEGYSTANGGRKWHTMPPLSIKDKFSEAIKKVTTLFHNVRYLYEVLGSSDISNLADGTVTGALSKLNTDLKHQDISEEAVMEGGMFAKVYIESGIVMVHGSIPAAAEGFSGTLLTMPEKYAPRFRVCGSVSYTFSTVDNGKVAAVIAEPNGKVVFYVEHLLEYAAPFTLLYPLKRS